MIVKKPTEERYFKNLDFITMVWFIINKLLCKLSKEGRALPKHSSLTLMVCEWLSMYKSKLKNRSGSSVKSLLISMATISQISSGNDESLIPCAALSKDQPEDWRQIRLCLLGKASHSGASPKRLDWLSTLPAFNVWSRKALTHYSLQRPSPFLS